MAASFLARRAASLHVGFSTSYASLFQPRKLRFEIQFSDERNRFEAENPDAQHRTQLRDLGWTWDRVNQIWFACSDDVALSAMEVLSCQ